MKNKIGLIIQGPITTIHNKTKKYYDSNHNIKKKQFIRIAFFISYNH